MTDAEERAIAGWLVEHVDGFSGFERLDKFGTGQSNPTYRVVAASGSHVLRAQPPGELLKGAHSVDREFRVMRALATTAIPVPRILALAERATSPIGRSFFVMEEVKGRVIFNPAMPDQTEGTRAAVHLDMVRTLARLHQVDIAAVGLTDFGRAGDYFERQIAIWSRQYAASVEQPLPDMEALGDWLARAPRPPDTAPTLIHGDYRLDNLILAADDFRILAVIDWELSTLGHPLADLAYLLMALRLPHDGQFAGLGGLDRAELGLSEEPELIDAYVAAGGADWREQLSFGLAFSYFRFAAILAGVHARALAGNASDPTRALRLGAAVPELAAAGLALTG